jgi:hypothetical protein
MIVQFRNSLAPFGAFFPVRPLGMKRPDGRRRSGGDVECVAGWAQPGRPASPQPDRFPTSSQNGRADDREAPRLDGLILHQGCHA